jgi:hypothetical protein
LKTIPFLTSTCRATGSGRRASFLAIVAKISPLFVLAAVFSATTTPLMAGPASCSSLESVESPSIIVGCGSVGDEIWAVSGQIQDTANDNSDGNLGGYFVWNPNTAAVDNLDIQLTGDSDYSDNPVWTFANLTSSGDTSLEADNNTETLFLEFDSPLPVGTSDPVGTQLTLSTSSFVDGETDFLTSGDATVVPEPGSSALALAGVLLVLIGGTKSRRKLLSR